MCSFGQNVTSVSKAEVVCNKERLNSVFAIKTRLSMQVLKSNQNLNFYLHAIKLQKTRPTKVLPIASSPELAQTNYPLPFCELASHHLDREHQNSLLELFLHLLIQT
jgi:hypothetical protein